ncbi:hypothetical protein [Bacillus sp. AFS055030]|uniref:hypothetical protein n=1 Tax=Bacillus sp. AFS055030 TaxID=2033507 RepID=UPI000BFE7063|nr:hypothetical protein [Bacillus sp. AFS055030]PGL67848.1 hypothetical protein CN925_17945 [Bacillus sp. AFS055030]
MTRDEAKRILSEEGLKYYNWFYQKDIGPNVVLIYKEDTKWVVCATDERASIVETSIAHYGNEEEALDDFIKRVRLEKILKP